MADATIEHTTEPCLYCGKSSVLNLPIGGFYTWKAGSFVSDAFPDMGPNEREMLISGTHPECWDLMFPEIEEDEEDGYEDDWFVFVDEYDGDMYDAY